MTPWGWKILTPTQLVALADHLQDHLDVLGVPDAHGVVDAALDGVEEELACSPAPS